VSEIRPAKPTIKEIREISQPVSVTGRSNAEHWVADVYQRKFSPYLTRIFIKLGFSANAVTWLMILVAASIGPALLIQGWTGILLALFLSHLQMFLDCCDGEVARWRNSRSPMGIFLDKLGHYTAESLIPICFGLRLAGWPDAPLTESMYPFLGALLAVLVILNKAFNDAVHVARAFSGLPRIADKKGVNLPRGSFLKLARRAFGLFPIHRLFHSIEFTIYITIFWHFEASIRVALGFALIVTVGHVLAITQSSKLQNPEVSS
jgi:phosphatidylglycerophosphate synthase